MVTAASPSVAFTAANQHAARCAQQRAVSIEAVLYMIGIEAVL